MNEFENIIDRLALFGKGVKLNSGVSANEIEKFERANEFILPPEYTAFVKKANGGEIFIPGTIIYGINLSETNKYQDLKSNNEKTTRLHLSIPNNYLIIAKLNFGDFICINLKAPHDVIQWDHELDEEYMNWSSFKEYLEESIEDYKMTEDDGN